MIKTIFTTILAAVAVTASAELKAPYTVNFDVATQPAEVYAIVDANGDGDTWQFSETGTYYYNKGKRNANDYIVLQPTVFEAGKIYDFTLEMEAQRNRAMTAFKLSTAPDATSLASATVVIATTAYKNTTCTMKGQFIPEETVTLYPAVYCCTDEDEADYTIIHSLSVSAPVSGVAPAAVKSFTVTPDVGGALTAALSIVPSVVDMEGNALEEATTLTVTRDSVEIARLTAQPGDTLVTFTDTAATYGACVYEVTPSNSNGDGLKTAVTAFVGLTTPTAPTGVTASRGAKDGSVKVSWEPVTKDIYGKNLTAVTYNIDGMALNGAWQALTTGVTDAEADLQVNEDSTNQLFARFRVYAVNTYGTSEVSKGTEFVPAGRPLDLDFRESFTSGKYDYTWASGKTEDSEDSEFVTAVDGRMAGINAIDDDGGYLFFTGKVRQDCLWLSSQKVNIPASATDPVVSLYYTNTGTSNINDIRVLANDGSGWAEVGKLNAGEVDSLCWRRATLPLTGCAGKVVEVRLQITYLGGNRMAFDQIKIYDRKANDINEVRLTTPRMIEAGGVGTFTVDYANNGLNAAKGYTVDLYCNDEQVASVDGPDVEAEGFASVTLTHGLTPVDDAEMYYYAVVNWTADNCPDNNYSATDSVVVRHYDYLRVADLSGERTGGVDVLTWSAPDLTAVSGMPTVDSFEYYDPWLLQFGDWTTVDADGYTVGDLNLYDTPCITFGVTKLAWYTFDSRLMGLRANEAATGRQCISTMYNYSEYGNTGANDDWAISPRLSGNAQTVSFKARSYTNVYGLETFNVLYSTTGTAVSDFKTLATKIQPPVTWTEYSYELPQGTRHFAVQCVSNDCFMLLLDDVSMELEAPELVVKGYNVYCNGRKLNDALLDTPGYRNVGVGDDDEMEYVVTVVYDKGESDASNAVTIRTVGIENVAVEGAAEPVEYYNLQGVRVEHPVSGNIYIRRQGRTAVKIRY